MTNKEWLIQSLSTALNKVEDYEILYHILESFKKYYIRDEKDRKIMENLPYYNNEGNDYIWCNGVRNSKCNIYSSCSECFGEWLDEKYVAKMPKLRNGTYVNVYLPDADKYINFGTHEDGIIVEDKIVFRFHKPVDIKNNLENIMNVYDADCFEECNEMNCIWSRE